MPWGLDDQIGSLEVGKKADLIVIDTRKPHLTPMYHPVSHLVYAVGGGDVSATVVNGRVLMKDRQLTHLDLRKLWPTPADRRADFPSDQKAAIMMFDTIIYNGTLVTLDKDMRIIPSGWIGIGDGCIRAMGAGSPPSSAGGEH